MASNLRRMEEVKVGAKLDYEGKSRQKRFIRILFAVLFSLFLPHPHIFSQRNETCLSCHGDKDSGLPYVNEKKFSDSIHRGNLCISCHKDAVKIPHPAPLASVSCGGCHRIETAIYLQSDHGKALSHGLNQAATCVSCHGKTHTLLSSRNQKSPVHRKNIPKTCASCHADKNKMKKFRLSEKEPFDTYMHSIHGESFANGEINAAVCSDCHGTHDLHASANPESKIFRRNILTTCGKCHENVQKVYSLSIHGKAMQAGIKEAPVCTDCHGEHTIRSTRDPGSSVWRGAITETCTACHSSEKVNIKFGLPRDRLKTYRDSYHGMAARGGDLTVANCASCHGWHDVLPSFDTQSSIHPKNLAQTCGKCHPGAQAKLLEGKIHGGRQAEEHFMVRLARRLYLWLLPLVIGAMALHSSFDYFKKALTQRTAPLLPLPHHDLERLNSNERLQHGVLLVTFTVLAYSGFALKYPDPWWAYPFQVVGGEALRKSVHRWTALVFVVALVYHLLYIFLSRRGRILLKRKLFLRTRDLRDAFRLQAYNMGLRKEKPELPYPAYIEKMEYWALVWGSFIMIATGGLLVFNDYALKYLPLWVSDASTVVHFYEAVLACLSIPVWHLYWTVFDPDVYPMNMAWLTGYLRGVVRKKKGDHEH